MAQLSGFYAYPSEPGSLIESIQEAIARINTKGKGLIEVTSWDSLRRGGKLVVSEICRAIVRSDLFICDASGLNPNVMFELGFAIAKNKRVWITVDGNIPNSTKLVQDMGILSSVGYHVHVNYDDIVNGFFTDAPYADLEATLLREYEGLVDSRSSGRPANDIFYLKSIVEHTASRKLTRFLDSLHRRMAVDDVLESSYQPLNWYLSNIIGSRIVIVHLLNEGYRDHVVENARYSLYAGMAFGFDRKLLMLAPEPFKAPFDYKDILYVHKKGHDCVEKARKWIYPLLSHGEQPETISRGIKLREDTEQTFLQIALGDCTAEREEAQLDSYFVETSQYRRGIQETMAVFVGRKGTGKTANLFRIRAYFQQQRNNLVITVKPLSFKLESYVKLVETYFPGRDVSGELTERIWRFLIYTTIAEQMHATITVRPSYHECTDMERELVEYVESNLDIVCGDFGDKIDYIYEQVCGLAVEGKNPKRVLKMIFDEHLSRLIRLLRGVLRPYQRVILLVDNLDKAWELGRDIEAQSKIIYGLLGFQNTLEHDLQWPKGETRLLVFLREDIFEHVLMNAREPDKITLNAHRILWDDPELLLRVIEERFRACDPDVTNEGVWEKYFCKTIDGTPTKEFLLGHILPRPRDLIHVVGNAIDECINHRHSTILEVDIRKALEKYFEFLLDNTAVEHSVSCPRIREIIRGFFGSRTVLSWHAFRSRLRNIPENDVPVEQCLGYLVRASFIGMKLNDQVIFAYSDSDAERLSKQLQNESRRMLPRCRLVIHPAFWAGLRLKQPGSRPISRHGMGNINSLRRIALGCPQNRSSSTLRGEKPE